MSDFPRETPYVIAEVGGNHGGDLDRAIEYIEAAAESGAHAVKFQCYSAETLIRRDEPPLPLAGDEYDTQYERFKELEFDRHEWEKLVEHACTNDIDFAASAFDESWADFVAEVSPFIKIASGDLTNIPLLRHVSDLGEPIVMSTGFSTLDEIRRAVSELPQDRLSLLHCVSSYPARAEDANLQLIDILDREFDVPIGYSDHTPGTLAPVSAVAKGATIVEKHFTLDKSNPVGDHRLSANPAEMEEIVDETRRVAEMHGEGDRRQAPLASEEELRVHMRRSLATSRKIEASDVITEDLVTTLRPETGISPFEFDDVVGKVAARDVAAGELLKEDDLRQRNKNA